MGCRLRYLGRIWTVERINDLAGHGPLLAITALDDGSFELICAKGCDGPFELVRGVRDGAVSITDKHGQVA